MKHAGKAQRSAFKLILASFSVLLVVLAIGGISLALRHSVGTLAAIAAGLWGAFALFTVYFFRDPEAKVPPDPNVVVAPAHGTVDLIDDTVEVEFIGGACRRISIFLSVIDVHVQQSPVSGSVTYFKYNPGVFLNALRTDSATYNENMLIGIQSSEAPGERIAVRLIAGLIARRIVPWVAAGNDVARGERISLIQFGSRVDLYLPLAMRIKVQMGDKVVGGETVMAARE